MLLSKGKIITAYYYIALIAFALSACAVMFEQESSGGIAYTNFIIAFAFMVWSVFVLRPFTKDYLIEIPSKTIIFFNLYMTWVLLVTAINPVGVEGISSYLNSLFWSAFPILILNSTYYFVLHKGDSRYSLSKEEDNIVGETRNLIGLMVDKKTGVITIHTEAQDPLISKSLADSVSSKLQVFITNYRTQKARHDVEYYKALTAKTKADYEKARQLYGSYSDANMDIVLESVRSKQADLENDMQLKFNAYTAMVTQLQAAEAKLRERTPAFTTLQGASVPIKPAKPRRMIFVLAITMLVFIGDLTYVLKGYILGKN
jgi:hypothetical protein